MVQTRSKRSGARRAYVRSRRRPVRRSQPRRPAPRRSQENVPLWVFGFLAVIVLSCIHPVIGVLALAGLTAWAVVALRAARERKRLGAARARELQSYLAMSPRQFEEAIAYLCRRDGCHNVRVVGGAGDLGADVKATTPDGRRLIVQCKRYGPKTLVSSGDVQKVNGTYRDAHQGDLAAIVTTSRFTKPAWTYAGQVGIRRIDVDALAGWASGSGPAPWQ